MKFHYIDKEAARNVLQGRLERAEQRWNCAQANLLLAKKHLEATPDSWKYAFCISDPHTSAKYAVWGANRDLARADDDCRKANKNLKMFDEMVGWDVVVIDGGE